MAEGINLFDIDAGQTYDDTLGFLEEQVGEPLYPGDERRIFGEAVALLLVAFLNKANDDARQSLLRYARGGVLDAMGERVDTPRIEPTAAETTLRFSLGAARGENIIIPAGTRATPDATHYFATTELGVLQAGELTVDIPAQATEGGSAANGFEPGRVNTLVDLVDYIASVSNMSTTAGGSDGEPDSDDGDNAYRERIRLAPAKFSTAGPEAAYRYHTLSADADIQDVRVTSQQTAGTIDIIVLMKDGEGPDDEVTTRIFEKVGADNVRPLNDKVAITGPEFIEYDIELKYYVTAETREAAVQTVEGPGGAVEQYRAWQDGTIGRDLNPDRLRALVLAPNWESARELTGALRVDVAAPEFQVLDETQVARWSGRLTVSHEVVEE